jgi:hypothetical protein
MGSTLVYSKGNLSKSTGSTIGSQSFVGSAEAMEPILKRPLQNVLQDIKKPY